MARRPLAPAMTVAVPVIMRVVMIVVMVVSMAVAMVMMMPVLVIMVVVMAVPVIVSMRVGAFRDRPRVFVEYERLHGHRDRMRGEADLADVDEVEVPQDDPVDDQDLALDLEVLAPLCLSLSKAASAVVP